MRADILLHADVALADIKGALLHLVRLSEDCVWQKVILSPHYFSWNNFNLCEYWLGNLIKAEVTNGCKKLLRKVKNRKKKCFITVQT